ncbi:hypothetical protein L1887_10606 [Cichorium endivia]|nr:hypothetical protein L1887_10606 [Cichorium endivia]
MKRKRRQRVTVIPLKRKILLSCVCHTFSSPNENAAACLPIPHMPNIRNSIETTKLHNPTPVNPNIFFFFHSPLITLSYPKLIEYILSS